MTDISARAATTAISTPISTPITGPVTEPAPTLGPTPPHSRKMFVNLPVEDLARSIAFFSALGFEFDPAFTDERAAAMVVSADAFVMLLVEDFFGSFTGKPVPETNEVVVALSADSTAEVDHLVRTALASGGSPAQDPIADGPMYGWSFLDPDGHQWELIHMDL